MANIDRANGFTPVRYLNGAAWNGQVNTYHIKSDYAVAMFIGDVVKLTGTTEATGKYQEISHAAASEVPVGVVVGFKPKPESGLDQIHSPASEEGYALVVDDPNVIFEAQIDGAVAAGDFGYNCSTSVVAGSTGTGRSGSELAYSTIANTATLDWKLLSIVDRPDNVLGANAKCLCIFNIHAYKNTTGVTGQ